MPNWRDDGVFIYPGDIPASGIHEGKKAVEEWFRNFLEQFPEVAFHLKDICVKNIFAMGGTNVVAVHWDIELTNRDGRTGTNSGVTVIDLDGGQVVRVKDYILDPEDKFGRTLGAEE